MDFKQNVSKLWTELKTNRDRYAPLWQDIEKFTGISVNADYMRNPNGNKAQDKDQFVDDPTSAISVNQAGDYLVGIMWGTGDKAVYVVPSRYVLEYASAKEVEPWFNFVTSQVLYHMNHSDAGLHTALKPYAYDQFSFGTSGIGAFPNKAFQKKQADNAFIFRSYGIDNTCIDEGANGLIEIVFTIHRWRVNRIIGEMCMQGGEIDKDVYDKLPQVIRDAHEKGNYNDEFNLVCGTFPRDDFDPSLEGKRGAKYCGVWFMDEGESNQIFYEEDYAEKPIAMARQIKVRGEVYGRSSGTLLMSTIRAVNFIMSNTIEIIEKMARPPLGVWNSAIFGDNVLDTSPDGLTVFNSALSAGGGNPLFPIQDVGDPSAMVQWLIPYLNDKVSTAFKVDALLDFNSAKDMTATESLQRYNIRGKSLAGILIQQKVECLEPITKRCISILKQFGELGVDASVDPDKANMLKKRNKDMRIIPEAVLEVMKSGRPWYELKYNNELEKLTRTEAVQNLLQILNSIAAMAGLYPQIIQAVDWYKLLRDINDNLDYNNQILCSAEEFKEKVEAAAEQQQMAMQAQLAQVGGQVAKDTSQANKANQEAQNVGRQ